MDIPICLSAKSFVGQTFVFEKIGLKLRHFNIDTLLLNLVYLAKERRTSQEFFLLTGKLKTIEKKSFFLVNKQQRDLFPILIENQQRCRIWLLTRHRPEVAFVFVFVFSPSSCIVRSLPRWKTIFNILYPRACIPHQAGMMLEFDVTANALCTNSAFQFGVTQL